MKYGCKITVIWLGWEAGLQLVVYTTMIISFIDELYLNVYIHTHNEENQFDVHARKPVLKHFKNT